MAGEFFIPERWASKIDDWITEEMARMAYDEVGFFGSPRPEQADLGMFVGGPYDGREAPPVHGAQIQVPATDQLRYTPIDGPLPASDTYKTETYERASISLDAENEIMYWCWPAIVGGEGDERAWRHIVSAFRKAKETAHALTSRRPQDVGSFGVDPAGGAEGTWIGFGSGNNMGARFVDRDSKSSMSEMMKEAERLMFGGRNAGMGKQMAEAAKRAQEETEAAMKQFMGDAGAAAKAVENAAAELIMEFRRQFKINPGQVVSIADFKRDGNGLRIDMKVDGSIIGLRADETARMVRGAKVRAEAARANAAWAEQKAAKVTKANKEQQRQEQRRHDQAAKNAMKRSR